MKNEVDYRLCKWMIAGMKNDGIITNKEMLKIRNNIVETIQPPFAEVEVNIKNIGDGITIGERKRKRKDNKSN